MEITEKHLQDIYDEIEEEAIKNAKNGDEEHGRIFAAWSMQTKLRCVLDAKSEEDFEFRKEFAKELARMVVLGNGDITAVKYDCGHPINPVIINTNEFTLMMYMEWKNNSEGLCIECWLKNRKEKKIELKIKMNG